MNTYSRALITAFKNLNQVKERYPNREVVPEAYCPDDQLYYFNPNGHARMLDLKDNTLWECDRDRGFPWMRRIK